MLVGHSRTIDAREKYTFYSIIFVHKSYGASLLSLNRCCLDLDLLFCRKPADMLGLVLPHPLAVFFSNLGPDRNKTLILSRWASEFLTKSSKSKCRKKKRSESCHGHNYLRIELLSFYAAVMWRVWQSDSPDVWHSGSKRSFVAWHCACYCFCSHSGWLSSLSTWNMVASWLDLVTLALKLDNVCNLEFGV